MDGSDDGRAVRWILAFLLNLPVAAVAATLIADPGIYQGQLAAEPGLGSPVTLGFEEFVVGAEIGDDYVPDGPAFEGPAPRVVLGEAFGAAARGSRLLAVGYTATDGAQLWMRFSEPQRAFGLWILDGSGPLLADALLGGALVDSFDVPALGEDLAGGVFLGMLFDGPVDELRLFALSPEDGFGVDDVRAAALGSVDNDGDGAAELSGDCDDGDPAVVPGGGDGCDGRDSDCDGFVDEDADADGDGHSPCAGDCDDADAARSPSVPEVCGNDLDENCDGAIDADADGDGDGYSACEGDCDDEDPTETPGGAESCDGYDNDCDALVDEGPDADGDGFTACEGDCDDFDAARTPSDDCDPEAAPTPDGPWIEPTPAPGLPGVGGGGCGCDRTSPGSSTLALLLLLPWRRRR